MACQVGSIEPTFGGNGRRFAPLAYAVQAAKLGTSASLDKSLYMLRTIWGTTSTLPVSLRLGALCIPVVESPHLLADGPSMPAPIFAIAPSRILAAAPSPMSTPIFATVCHAHLHLGAVVN